MPLLRLPPAIISSPDCPPCHLRLVSVVISDPPPFLFRHQGLLVVDHHIHHHIEDGGRQWFTLSDASLSAEGLSVVPSCPCHHLKPLPILEEEEAGPGPHYISLQDVHEPGPVQCIVCLVQAQEDFMEHRLPQGHNLLEQLDLEGDGGVPRPAQNPWNELW